MSLKPELILEVPELTEEVARAAFPKGNPYLTLRDKLGTIFEDEDFLYRLLSRAWTAGIITLATCFGNDHAISREFDRSASS